MTRRPAAPRRTAHCRTKHRRRTAAPALLPAPRGATTYHARLTTIHQVMCRELEYKMAPGAPEALTTYI